MPGLRRAVALFGRTAIVLAAIVFSATAQAAPTVRIETAPGGNAPLLASQSRAAGDTLRVFAAAYDGNGQYTGPLSVDWSTSPALAAVAPARGTTALVSLGTAGSFTVQAAHGSGQTATSGTILVLAGPPAQLVLSTAPGAGGTPVAALTMSADSTLVLYAASVDAFANFSGAVEATWSADGKLARLAPAQAALTVIDAWTAGSGFLHAQAPGLPALSLPLAVVPGRLASLRASRGVAATAFGDTLVTVGSTFALHAQGFDADGNRVVPDPVVSWSAQGSGLLVLPPNGSQTSVTAISAGSGRVVAATVSVSTTTGVIQTTAGALVQLKISEAPDAVVPVGALNATADESLALFVLGLDAAGNLIGPVNGAWSSSDAAVAWPLAVNGVSNRIEFGRAGTARIRVALPGLGADSTAVLTVAPGAFAALQIEDRPDGSGTEVGAVTVSADSTHTFYAVGRDADGNALGAHAAQWSLTGPLGSLAPGLGASTLFTPVHAGTAYLTAVAGPYTALAGPLTVTPGAPYALRIEDGGGAPLAARALFAGETLTAAAEAVDQDGNRLGAVDAVWAWIGDALATPPAVAAPVFTWQAQQAGAGRLHATAPGMQPDTSAVLTVLAGPPAALILRDAAGNTAGAATLSADSTLELFAYAIDAGGNELGQVPVVWSVTGVPGLAGVAPLQGSATELRPHHPGEARVRALHVSGLQAEAGPFTILPGMPVRVRIESAADGSGTETAAAVLVAGTTLPLYAVGRDAQGNATGPLAANWFVSGGIGSLDPTAGTSTLLTALRVGTGTVRITVPLFDGDVTGTLQVQAGAASQLVVESSAGDPFDAIGPARISADDSLVAFAVARDAWGNFVADVPAAWTWSGTADAAATAAGPTANAAVLRVLRPGNGRLQAAWNGWVAETGTLTLVAGAAANLGIESTPDGNGIPVGDRALQAGDVVALHAVARDGHGNFVAAIPAAWNVLGVGAGLDLNWGPTVQLTARAPGTVRVTAVAAGVNAGSTGNFSIAAGAPASLQLERGPGDPSDPVAAATLVAGDGLPLFAVLRDAFGNWAGEAPAAWSVSGTAGAAVLETGSASAANVLRALHPGSVSLLVTWGPFAVQSPSFTVVTGPLAALTIETAADGSGVAVGDRALGAGSSMALHAVGRDAWGNFLGNMAAGWSVEGNAGAVDAAWGPSVRFTASRPGTSRVLALHSSLPPASTGTITVSAGSAAALFVEQTPGDPLDPWTARALAAGDSLPAFAVWRDSLGNVVGTAPADWSLEGTSGAAELSVLQGTGTVLRARHPGRVWLHAAGNGSETVLGPLDIRAGTASGSIVLAAIPDTLRADGQSTTVLDGGPVTDAWGNPAADGTRVDVQLLGVNTPVAEDQDPVAPGVQRTLAGGRFTLALVAGTTAGPATVRAFAQAAEGQLTLTVLPVAAPAIVAGSLGPHDWLRGTPWQASLEVQHAGAVALQIERAALRLDDGNGAALETALEAPVTALPGAPATLRFAPLLAPALFRAGRFAPVLHLEGHDTLGHAFRIDLAAGASSVQLFDGAAAHVDARTPDRLTRGTAVELAVDVAGAGDAVVTLDAARCRLLGAPGATAPDSTVALQITPGSTTTLRFDGILWPADAAPGDVALQLELHGTQPGGAFDAVLPVPPVRVEAAATLQDVAGTLLPALAPVGATPAPRVALRNTGGSAVRLDTRTTIWLAGHGSALVTPLAIGPDSVATLEFSTLDLAGQGSGRWPLELRARGTQNGTAFAQDLALADSLTLFAPNALTIVGIQPSQPNVTARQTTPWSLRLVLWNAGVVPYQIDDAALRIVLGGVDRTADYTLVRHKPLAPYLAPAGRDTLEVIVTRTGGDTGLATLEAVVQATDLASGRTVVANTFNSGKGSLRVQAPGNLVAAPPVWSQPTVVAGQSATVEMSLQVRNAGEATVVLDSLGLAAASATAPAVPVQARIAAGVPSLGAGEALTLVYSLGPFLVPPGSLQLDVAPAGIETNRGAVLAAAANAVLQVVPPAAVDVLAAEAPAHVTQSQSTPFSIRFDVANLGGATARLEMPHVEWTAGGPAPVFTVRDPATFENGGALVLPPGARQTLHFDVEATDPLARTVQAQAVMTVHEEWSGRTWTVRGSVPASLRVDTPPDVQFVPASLAPASAAVGQLGEITILAQNLGEALLALVPARSWARVVGGTVTHPLAQAASLGSGAATLLRFGSAAFDGVPGDAAVEFHLEGVHNGNAWSADLGPAAGLRLERASSLEITAVEPGASRVTRGQSRAWRVRARVHNHGGPAAFQAAHLAFTLGTADVTTGFAVSAPGAFESGAVTLAAGARDSLLFDVTQTADVTGFVVVDATAQTRDLNTGTASTVTSVGPARGGVRVETAAAPQLQPLVLSQSRVSAGQRGAWRVQATVRNAGGSPWMPDFAQATLAIGSAPDDSIALLPPAVVRALDAGESANFGFEVRRTGPETGPLALRVQLAGAQTTDGVRMAAVAPPAIDVLSQSAPAARIDSLVARTARPNVANAGQWVEWAATLRNTGEAGLDSVGVALHAEGAVPADTLLVAAVPGGGRVTFRPRLRLRADAGPVQVTLSGLYAADANDSTQTQAWSGSRQTAAALVAETPGALALTVVPSQARVSAGQTREWSALVQVRNTGHEPLVLRPPVAGDLEFRRGGTAQNDYIVVAPATLLSGGLELDGGAEGTLAYRITRTGNAGGAVEIHADAQAVHRNEPSSPMAAGHGSTAVEVDAMPGLRIVSTESRTYRRDRGFDDFRVNTGQEFQILVVVENTGGTVLDSIVVDVVSQRGNSRLDGPKRLDSLAPGERAEVAVPVTAGAWLSQTGLPESFTASVRPARDHNSGLTVLPGAALDATTFAYVESPARLALEAGIESPEGAQDGILSGGQTFVFGARLQNEGGAGVTENARVALVVPVGYAILAGDAEQFAPLGTPVRWTLRAPQADRAPGDSLVAVLTAVPTDANAGSAAAVRSGRSAVGVEVHAAGELQADLFAETVAAALRGTVSTGQALDLGIAVRGDADLADRTAEIELPAGWRLAPGTPPKIDLPPGTEVRTAAAVVAGDAAGPVRIVLRTAARNRNDDSIHTATDTLDLVVQRASRLAVDAGIVSPAEAQDGRVLPGQQFQVRAWVRNQGDAGTSAPPGRSSAGTLRLVDVPAGWAVDTVEQGFDLPGAQTAVQWNVTAPSAARAGVAALRIVFGVLPLDANSAAPVAVDPDSGAARCVVATANDAVRVETNAAVLPLAAPGQKDLALLQVTLHNDAEAPVRLESLGVESLLDGILSAGVFERFELRRDGVPGVVFAARAAASGPTWIPLTGSGSDAVLAPGAAAVWELRADVGSQAAGHALGAALRDHGTGAALVRVVEAGSNAAVPVTADGAHSLATNPLRVLGAAVTAYNAPNPFHAEREATQIFYRVDGDTEVAVRIYTLQGELVWDATQHEAASGAALRSLAWDGRNGAGEWVRNGVYVCTVKAGPAESRFKIAVAR